MFLPFQDVSEAKLFKMKNYLRQLVSGESLKAQLWRGGAWLGGGSFLEQLLRFGRNMLLARILAPEAFGTMAIILSTTSIFQSLSDVGVRESLIQNPRGAEEEYTTAAWWLAFGRSIGLYVCLFVGAPLLASFYRNPQLTALLRVAAVGLLFEGAISSKAYVAVKHLQFRTWALINHCGGIAGVIITVGLSFFIRNAWALAIGFAVENAARFLLSYALCPCAPWRSFHRAASSDLLKFSRGMVGLSLLNLIFSRTDIFVLAKLFSPAELGFYSMAVYLIQTPSSFIVNLLGQTFMPTFARIQQDEPRLNRMFLQVSVAAVLIGMPVIAFLVFCGRSLLSLVYGQAYAVGSAALTVASGVALMNVLNALITTVFYAKGRPQLHRRSVAMMAVLMMVLTYPLARHFGLLGGQLGAAVAIAVGYIFQVERIANLTHVNLRRYGKAFVTGFAVSLCVVFVCMLARYFSLMVNPLPQVLWGVAGCLAAYTAAAIYAARRLSVAT